jgi:hypothetical protein
VLLFSQRAKGDVEKELRASIPHQTTPLQIKITYDIKFFHGIRIVEKRRQTTTTSRACTQKRILHIISYMISYMISYTRYDIIFDII